jgi:hypothetical protein
MKYYRIIGEYGTYILSQAEIDLALDRENNTILFLKNSNDILLEEKQYSDPFYIRKEEPKPKK